MARRRGAGVAGAVLAFVLAVGASQRAIGRDDWTPPPDGVATEAHLWPAATYFEDALPSILKKAGSEQPGTLAELLARARAQKVDHEAALGRYRGIDRAAIEWALDRFAETGDRIRSAEAKVGARRAAARASGDEGAEDAAFVEAMEERSRGDSVTLDAAERARLVAVTGRTAAALGGIRTAIAASVEAGRDELRALRKLEPPRDRADRDRLLARLHQALDQRRADLEVATLTHEWLVRAASEVEAASWPADGRALRNWARRAGAYASPRGDRGSAGFDLTELAGELEGFPSITLRLVWETLSGTRRILGDRLVELDEAGEPDRAKRAGK